MIAPVKVLLTILLIVVAIDCQDIQPIATKPGICFKIHTPSQPHFYQNPRRPEYANLFEACTEWLKEPKDCLGIRTQNNETLVLSCKGVMKGRPGCYKLINADKKEEVVCQKLNKEEECQVITTKTNLSIVVHCAKSTSRGLSTFDVKTNKPRRELQI